MTLSLPKDYADLKHIFCGLRVEISISTFTEMLSNREHIKKLKWYVGGWYCRKRSDIMFWGLIWGAWYGRQRFDPSWTLKFVESRTRTFKDDACPLGYFQASEGEKSFFLLFNVLHEVKIRVLKRHCDSIKWHRKSHQVTGHFGTGRSE